MKMRKSNISRAVFLKTAAAAAGAFALAPIAVSCGRRDAAADRSNIRGVRIGAISYSFRSMPSDSAGDTLLYTLGAGLGSLEIMGDVLERHAGKPTVAMPRPPEGGATDNPRIDKRALHAAMERARKENMRITEQWIRHADYDRISQLAQAYRTAGVGMHIAKFNPSADMSDEHLEHIFKACCAAGAMGVSTELDEETARRAAPFAEKYGKYLIFHNHFQAAGRKWHSYDPYLRHSRMIMINFDAGHYFGCTGNDPCDMLREYHDRIVSLHIKDKTSPRRGNRNMPWGEGETPLPQLLDLVASNSGKKGWPVHCDIELEYPVPEGSTAVQEVARCLEYAHRCLTE